MSAFITNRNYYTFFSTLRYFNRIKFVISYIINRNEDVASTQSKDVTANTSDIQNITTFDIKTQKHPIFWLVEQISISSL